jgi:DNA ligase 1
VGDLAETIALVLPPPGATSDRPLAHWIDHIRGLARLDPAERRAAILAAWDALDVTERFVFNKLITGGFRMGVSPGLMTRALAEATGHPEPDLAHRLMGDWSPERTTWERLVLSPDPGEDLSRPYPFYLAYQLDAGPEGLGDPAHWAAEHKWDGIRGQLILRGGAHHLWSRGEELMTDRFPELAAARDFLPEGTVIDGEVLAWADGRPLPFAALQKRIGRKTVPKKLLAEAPVILRAYDLLEWEGQDIRDRPFAERRAILDASWRPCPPRPRSACRPSCPSPLGGPRRNPRPLARRRRRGADAEAAGLALPFGAQEGRLVEMEGRPAHHRRGDDLCPVRPRPPRDPLHRLHLRGPRRQRSLSPSPRPIPA